MASTSASESSVNALGRTRAKAAMGEMGDVGDMGDHVDQRAVVIDRPAAEAEAVEAHLGQFLGTAPAQVGVVAALDHGEQ